MPMRTVLITPRRLTRSELGEMARLDDVLARDASVEDEFLTRDRGDHRRETQSRWGVAADETFVTITTSRTPAVLIITLSLD